MSRAHVVEMLHHALSPSSEEEPRNPMNMKLRAEDKTSAGDNLAFLQSKLTWDIGTDGRERVLDADGNGSVPRLSVEIWLMAGA